ncbi:hypothetical protein ACIU1J_01930 [Azospirillum doebereinerae]|uniref:head-tail joining protein n=1 Tax=Azospirillum doebereinerae TaxID=92933 RepID=UPI001EE523C1|nr:hypothetical protein [Azospirillum doebereinerae]MCG5240091.1 hypothetical protein [Azospirillum doebereinerae]
MSVWAAASAELAGACLASFGETATLFPGLAGARDVVVIFDEKWTETDPETGIGVSSTAPRIRALPSDLAGVVAGDRIRVRGKPWTLADLQPDGHGMTMGVLSR